MRNREESFFSSEFFNIPDPLEYEYTPTIGRSVFLTNPYEDFPLFHDKLYGLEEVSEVNKEKIIEEEIPKDNSLPEEPNESLLFDADKEESHPDKFSIVKENTMKKETMDYSTFKEEVVNLKDDKTVAVKCKISDKESQKEESSLVERKRFSKKNEKGMLRLKFRS